MKTAFVLLAHEKPSQLRTLIESLCIAGSNVFVHHDASSQGDLSLESQKWELEKYAGKLFIAPRVDVRWGEWSIVQATLNCLQLAREMNDDSDYYMLISGSCLPVKPICFLEEQLAKSPFDYIETVNAIENRWINDGIQEERWSHYHFFNWRYQQRLFDLSLKIQTKIGIKRKLPNKHTPHMGSQWWCLRKSTIHSILNFIEKYPKVKSFYKKTWVPDELFFQTMVANLIPADERQSKTLTRYTFNSWGTPRIYYNDDYPELLSENAFFVRKVSPRATELRNTLANIAALSVNSFQELLDASEAELITYMGQLQLKDSVRTNRWHSLVSYEENVYDYIKSIPNRIILVCSSNKIITQQSLELLDNFTDTVVLRPDAKTINNTTNKELSSDSYECSDEILSQFDWHIKLGDLAFRNPEKTLVFAIGSHFTQYLEVLRWKDNLHIVIVDNDRSSAQNTSTLKEIYFISKVLYLLQDRHCEISRFPFTQVKKIAHEYLEKLLSFEHFLHKIPLTNTKSPWPCMINSDQDNPYKFQHPTRNIVLLTGTSRLIESYIHQIQQELDIEFCDCFSDSIEIHSNDCNLQLYLNDIFSLVDSQSKISNILIHLQQHQLNFLSQLCWNHNLLVLDIYDDTPCNAKPLPQFRFKLEGSREHIEAINTFQKDITRIVSNGQCEYFRISSNNSSSMADYISIFLDEKEYLSSDNHAQSTFTNVN